MGERKKERERWEYIRRTSLITMEALNALGAGGWELTCSVGTKLYLRRRLPTFGEPTRPLG